MKKDKFSNIKWLSLLAGIICAVLTFASYDDRFMNVDTAMHQIIMLNVRMTNIVICCFAFLSCVIVCCSAAILDVLSKQKADQTYGQNKTEGNIN